MDKTCGECGYFDGAVCRRYPPVPLIEIHGTIVLLDTKFPVVSFEQKQCGEFKQHA